ncbi:NAD(P)/FAD-dependent oxidoreductase, partial [Paracoccus versutus]
AAVDVVIVGGGIIGVTTALELAERGISVALCEKGVIAGEQSSRNWGWTRQMGRDERELPLCMHSVEMWSQMNERIGRDTGWRRTGISYLSYNRRDLKGWLAWEEIGRRHGLDARMLSQAEIAEKLPGNNGGILGVLHTASDGRAEPWIA